jgi:hypothetical protein
MQNLSNSTYFGLGPKEFINYINEYLTEEYSMAKPFSKDPFKFLDDLAEITCTLLSSGVFDFLLITAQGYYKGIMDVEYKNNSEYDKVKKPIEYYNDVLNANVQKYFAIPEANRPKHVVKHPEYIDPTMRNYVANLPDKPKK